MDITVRSNKDNLFSNINQKRSGQNTSNSIGNFGIGDILHGTVTKVFKQVTVSLNDKSVQLSKDMLPNAKEGEVVNFQVTDRSKDSYTLKLMQDQTDVSKMAKNISCTVVSDQMEFTMEETGFKEKEEEANGASKNLDDISNKMSEEDYHDLSEEEFSLEKYELERFDRALDRIKTQRSERAEAISKNVEERKKTREVIEDISLSQIDNANLKQQIEMILKNANLPITKANVEAVSKAVEMSRQATNLNDSSMKYLLENNLEPSALNIYMATYSAKNSQTNQIVEGDWEELSGQVRQVLDGLNQQGIHASMEEAKWLYDRNLPINEELLKGYQDLVKIQQGLDVNETIRTVVSGMAKGEDGLKVSLSMQAGSEVKESIRDYANITDKALENAVASDVDLNLVELRSQINEVEFDHSNLQKELELITARRQLEEIRVKLTYDAGLKLVNKGVNIQTQDLESLVNELRNLENDYYAKLLQEADIPVSQEAISLLRMTSDTTAYLAKAPTYILGNTIRDYTSVTIEKLARDGEVATHRLNQLQETYEPLMTAPRADMGDSIKKAFASVDHLLDEVNLDHTVANERAVRILGYNQMEITKESIEEMKAYDYEVTSLIEKLHPSTTVELIKEKINPLNTPIHELNEYIDKIQTENGATEEEKYSTYLAKIQKNDTLNQEERDAYIGIYRLLNNVEKTDGKAVGMLVQSNRELTLNNLLSAVRTIKGHGINETIDESFGTLESLTYETDTITGQLEATFSGASNLKENYQNHLNQDLLTNLSPEFLEYVSGQEDIMDLTLENLTEQYNTYAATRQDGDSASYVQFMNECQAITMMQDEIRFLKDYHIKTNMRNIKAANKLFDQSASIYDTFANQVGDTTEIDRLESSMNGEIDTISEWNQTYVKSMEALEGQMRSQFCDPNLTVDDMMHLNSYLYNTSLMKDLASQQYYKVPISVNGTTVDVGVSFQSGTEEKGKVSISLNSQEFGDVSAEFKLEDGNLKGFITCENKSAQDVLTRVVDNFKNELENHTQVNVQQMIVSVNQTQDTIYRFQNTSNEDNNIETKHLFTVAEKFITSVKEISA